MSSEALRWALDAPVIGAAKSVLVALAWHADKSGGGCRPSTLTLARYAGMQQRNVTKVLGQLVRERWITVAEPARGIRPTAYQLNLSTPVLESPPSQDHPRLRNGGPPSVGPLPPSHDPSTPVPRTDNQYDQYEHSDSAHARVNGPRAARDALNGTAPYRSDQDPVTGETDAQRITRQARQELERLSGRKPRQG